MQHLRRGHFRVVQHPLLAGGIDEGRVGDVVDESGLSRTESTCQAAQVFVSSAFVPIR